MCRVCGGTGGHRQDPAGGEAVQSRKAGSRVFSTFCESHASDIAFRVVARLLRAAAGVRVSTRKARGHACGRRFPTQTPRMWCCSDDLLGIADPEVKLPRIDPSSSAAVDRTGECRDIGAHQSAL